MEYTSTPLNEINQEDEDFDGLAAHPQRGLIQIAHILEKMDMPFDTYSGHLAQIGIQHSAEAPRDEMPVHLTNTLRPRHSTGFVPFLLCTL